MHITPARYQASAGCLPCIILSGRILAAPPVRDSTFSPLEMWKIAPTVSHLARGQHRDLAPDLPSGDLSSFLSRDHISCSCRPTVSGSYPDVVIGWLWTKTRHRVPPHWHASKAAPCLSERSRRVTPQRSLPLRHIPSTQNSVPHVAGAEYVNGWMH